MLSTEELYQILFKYMGPQHWWPAENAIEIIFTKGI